MSRSQPRVQSLEVAAYRIPADDHEQDGTLDWDATTLVVVWIHAGGETALGYTYGPAAIAPFIDEKLADVVRQCDPFAPQAGYFQMLDRVRNAGAAGISAMAISAVDVALWDLKGRLLNLPLRVLLGASRTRLPIYGSGGFTSYDDQRLAEQLGGWVEQGIPRVKMKVGREPHRDLHRVAAARRAVGDAELFVDANGAYSVKQALRLGEEFHNAFGVTWFEEPRPSGDLVGLRLLRDRGPAGLEVAAGEYGYVLQDFRRLLEAGSIDVLQMDATRCGGVTGFLAAAEIARAFEIETSAHCAPALHAHLGCALPALRHVEYFHDHVRIESKLFDGLPRRDGGDLIVDSDAPGFGWTLKRADAEKFRVAEGGRS